MTDRRQSLIEAVEQVQARQRAREMSEEELDAAICEGLGLPRGTQFTDEQWEMILAGGSAPRG